MKSIFPRTARLGAVLILTVGATPSEAALVSYLSGAATQTSSPVVYNLDPDWDPALGPQPGGFDRHFFQGLNAFSNQAFGSEVATSSASLQTGAVRARCSSSSRSRRFRIASICRRCSQGPSACCSAGWSSVWAKRVRASR